MNNTAPLSQRLVASLILFFLVVAIYVMILPLVDGKLGAEIGLGLIFAAALHKQL